MSKYYLTTTGTVAQVNLKDLGLIFNHPTVNHNLLDRVTLEVLLNSKSLHNALINNEITLKDENSNPIDSQNYYQRESVILTLENKVKTSNLDLNADFLVNKIIGGNNVEVNEQIISGERKINIDMSITSTSTHFTFTQNTPQTIWNIVHNLNGKPSIDFYDEFGEPFKGYYKSINPTTSQAIFNFPTKGTAECQL